MTHEAPSGARAVESSGEPGRDLQRGAASTLAELIDAALPQTQCTRCGEPDCRRYAEAVAEGRRSIDRCPPGGAEGIVRLAAITGQSVAALDPACGSEGPLRLAVIDEAWCIGCTLCIKACPVDCIVGASKHMHTVIEAQCTGCELCVPACPVDCIDMVALDPRPEAATGWAAWSPAQADAARLRYAARAQRDERRRGESVPTSSESAPRPDRIAAALSRARAERSGG